MSLTGDIKRFNVLADYCKAKPSARVLAEFPKVYGKLIDDRLFLPPLFVLDILVAVSKQENAITPASFETRPSASGWKLFLETIGRRALSGSVGNMEHGATLIRATAESTEADIADMKTDEAMTRRALDLLGSKRNDAYEAALAALREDTRQWWAETLARNPDELDEGEEAATADVPGLYRFLEGDVLPWFETRAKELANRPLIREQAFGESLDPDKLERLGRYEVHLDRKLERMLAMLMRLRDLRQGDVVD